jgi:hypothetical protein
VPVELYLDLKGLLFSARQAGRRNLSGSLRVSAHLLRHFAAQQGLQIMSLADIDGQKRAWHERACVALGSPARAFAPLLGAAGNRATRRT